MPKAASPAAFALSCHIQVGLIHSLAVAMNLHGIVARVKRKYRPKSKAFRMLSREHGSASSSSEARLVSQEDHKRPIYCISFNHSNVNNLDCFATVGTNRVRPALRAAQTLCSRSRSSLVTQTEGAVRSFAPASALCIGACPTAASSSSSATWTARLAKAARWAAKTSKQQSATVSQSLSISRCIAGRSNSQLQRDVADYESLTKPLAESRPGRILLLHLVDR